MSRATRLNLLKVLGAVLALAIWWATSASSTNIYYPPMPDVLTGVVDYWLTGPGTEHLVSSLINLFAGLGIAIVAGIGIGLLVGQVRIVDRAISPTFEFVRAIPATALVPFAMVLFGIGTEMKIFIIALGCFFPILLNVVDACRALPSQLHDTTRSFNIRGPFRQLFVVVPAIAPRAASGIRVAIPLGLILVVTSEMTGTNLGIGHILMTAQSSFNLAAVWGAIVILGTLGVLLNLAFAALERRSLRWHYDQAD
ncbi:ABC transporter permease [Georgenia sp. Z1344]|uniref:ABC transporter permease n=1 Tax=Georgenia sp. Z1344 TaxID=3416706 RepID=UPI003CECE6CE